MHFYAIYILPLRKIYNSESMKLINLAISSLIAISAVSCSDNQNKVSEQEILRLDKTLYNYKNMDSLSRANVRDSLKAQIKALAQVLKFDTICDESLLAWSESMPVEMFSPMADTAFTSLTKIEEQLGSTLLNAKNKDIKLPNRHYVSVVWGRPESIVFNDSIALIALNHYLGAESPAYEHWPSYKRALKRQEMLIYDITEATIATEYPFQPFDGENTVLSHILYEGALAYIKMQIIPEAKLSCAVGLSESQLNDSESNLQFMWSKLAAEQMLYSTDSELINRLFAQLPYSSPISSKAPGRCVRVLGYKIVQAYMQNNKSTKLQDLLSPKFYSSRNTLNAAQFSPSKAK
jgi:hypothetical protein